MFFLFLYAVLAGWGAYELFFPLDIVDVCYKLLSDFLSRVGTFLRSDLKFSKLQFSAVSIINCWFSLRKGSSRSVNDQPVF